MLRQSHIDTTLIYTHMDSERIGAQGRMLERMLLKNRGGSVATTGASTGASRKRMDESRRQQLPCYYSVLTE